MAHILRINQFYYIDGNRNKALHVTTILTVLNTKI